MSCAKYIVDQIHEESERELKKKVNRIFLIGFSPIFLVLVVFGVTFFYPPADPDVLFKNSTEINNEIVRIKADEKSVKDRMAILQKDLDGELSPLTKGIVTKSFLAEEYEMRRLQTLEQKYNRERKRRKK